jgi:ankyrin repeat protein
MIYLKGAALAVLLASPALAENVMLDQAFWKGADLAKVQAAIEAGNSASEVDEDKFSPLYRALQAGVDVEILKVLVEHGADVNAYGNDASPVMLGARSCDVPCIQFLIDAGADLGTVDDSWRDALNWGAGRQKDPAVLEALVAAGAKDSQDVNGRTPAFTAARMNANLPAVEYLVGVSDVKVIDVNGNNALMWAALRNDNPEVVAFVFDLVDDQKLTNQDGRDALLLSAIRKRKTTDVPAFFLAKGYDVSATDKAGRTALSLAAEGNSAAAVQLFIDAGAQVDAADADGKTALHYAAEKNSADVVAALLASGADASVASNDGQTALALAAGRDDGAEIVEVLKAAGAE